MYKNPYSNIFDGSYILSRENMRFHLANEHEEKLNVIDSLHNEEIQSGMLPYG